MDAWLGSKEADALLNDTDGKQEPSPKRRLETAGGTTAGGCTEQEKHAKIKVVCHHGQENLESVIEDMTAWYREHMDASYNDMDGKQLSLIHI